MKAIIYEKYGIPDVLQLVEVEKPAPKAGQVLVKIHAASVNSYDWHFLSADIFLIRFMGRGFLKPNNGRLGVDIAGRIDAVGDGVQDFKLGNEVFGEALGGEGGFAEYALASEKDLVLKPASVPFEEAAATPMAAITALQALRDCGKLRKGQTVLIQGASGGVGTFAVQLAKFFGAEVTAVCSARNVGQAQELGADYVIDYAEADFTRSGRHYDLILACNGYHPLSAYKRVLAPGGIYVMVGGTPKQIFQCMVLSGLMSNGDKRLCGVTARIAQDDLQKISELLGAGKLRPIIDRRFALEETADAMRYLGEGHARGKVVITVV